MSRKLRPNEFEWECPNCDWVYTTTIEEAGRSTQECDDCGGEFSILFDIRVTNVRAEELEQSKKKRKEKASEPIQASNKS